VAAHLMRKPLRLAPQFIYRCAAWPLDLIESLVDQELAQAAATPDESYGARYDAALLEQRRRLWAVTFDDPRFRRGLALTNPEFSHRLETKSFKPQRDKQARHLDGALYRYLSRAVGRTEPADAWAGVGLGTWGTSTRVLAGARRYAFAPDLRAFQQMLRALARTDRYVRVGRYKLNETIRIGDRVDYLQRSPSGPVVRRRMAATPALRSTLAALDGQPLATRNELANLLTEALEIDGATAASLVTLAIDAGWLVGGLDLPARFDSAWRALAGAAQMLVDDDRRAWWRALVHLRRICRRLEADFEELSIGAIRARVDAIHREVIDLAAALGLADMELGVTQLRGDMRLCHEVQLGPEWRRRIAAMIERCDAFERAAGLLTASGDLHRERCLPRAAVAIDELPEPPPWAGLQWNTEWSTWEALSRQTGDHDRLRAAMKAWGGLQQETGPVPAAAVEQATPPHLRAPLGAIVFRPTPNGAAFVSGFGAEAAMLFARFDRLLAPGGACAQQRPGTGIARWFQQSLAELERASGLVIAEYVAPLEHRPNALSRPRMTSAIVCPWTVEPAAGADDRGEVLSLAGARIVKAAQPFEHATLELADGRRAVVMSLVSANLSSQDGLGEALLFTSFRAIPQWIFALYNLPFAHELEAPRLTAPVALGDGVAVLRARLVLSGTALDALVSCPPCERFRRWQALARASRLPPLISARRDQEQPLLVARDSPLSVEVLFDAAARRSRHIIIEALPDEGWLKDQEGKRYLCELAVPFVWSQNAWNAGVARMDTDQRRAYEPKGGVAPL
jgi:hypothetical protein